jgi:DNA processing protein
MTGMTRVTPLSAPPDERWARAALCRYCAPGDPSVAALVRAKGPVAALADLRNSAPLRERFEAALVDRDLTELDRLGGRLVVPGDEEWPVRLDALATAPRVGGRRTAEPFALWVRGPLALDDATARSVAIVGSRAATSYGEHIGGELAAGLAERGWTVVSGGAYGIDAASHRGALAVGGRTVVVLAGGCDVLYPPRNATLLERILATGLVLSEVPPGFASMRERFLSRNRIVAGLARGTVIVEAGPRSGALNTAGHTLAVNHPLCAVPGPVTSFSSAGCNALIRRDSARLVTTAAEVLEEIAPVGEVLALPLAGPSGVRDDLPAIARRLLDAVPSRRAVSADRLAGKAGLTVPEAWRLLGVLQDHGLVEHAEQGWVLTDLGRQPSGAAARQAAAGDVGADIPGGGSGVAD